MPPPSQPFTPDSMLAPDRYYEVHDSQGRHWGQVRLMWPYKDSQSGRLMPAAGYEPVRALFRRHAELLADPASGGEADFADTSRQIAALGVVMRDTATGQEHAVGPVFVSEELLFSCSF